MEEEEEREEEVKDGKAEGGMNVSGRLKNADYGSPSGASVLSTVPLF